MANAQSHVQAPSDYVYVCDRDEIPERGKKTVYVEATRVLIVASNGGLFAVEDRCPQTASSMARGEVLGTVITSPTTGARYDLRTGRYVGGGQAPLQSHWLPVLPLSVIDDRVYVRLPQR